MSAHVHVDDAVDAEETALSVAEVHVEAEDINGNETESEESDLEDPDADRRVIVKTERRQVQFDVSEEDEQARKEAREAKLDALFIKPYFDIDFHELVSPNANPKLRTPDLDYERLGDEDLCDLDVQLTHRRMARRVCRRLKMFDRADWDRMNLVYQMINDRVEENVRNDHDVSTFLNKQLEVEQFANENFVKFGISHPAFRALSDGLSDARNIMKFDEGETNDFHDQIKACDRIDKVFRKTVTQKAGYCTNGISRTGRETALGSYTRELQKDIELLKNGSRPSNDVNLASRKYQRTVEEAVDDDIELADLVRKVVSGETKRLTHSKEMMQKFLKRKKESLEAELKAVTEAIEDVDVIHPEAIVKDFTDELLKVNQKCVESRAPLRTRYDMARRYPSPPQVLKSGTVLLQTEKALQCMSSMFKSPPSTQSVHALVSSNGYLHTFEKESDNVPDASYPIKSLRNIEVGERSFGEGKREYVRFEFPASLRKKGGAFLFFVNSDDKASDWLTAMNRCQSAPKCAD